MIGAGGVGDATAKIAVERDYFDIFVVADYDLSRAQRTVRAVQGRRPGERRFHAVRSTPPVPRMSRTWLRLVGATHVLNAVDPRFVADLPWMPGAAGANYVDMAMSLSRPHPKKPYSRPGQARRRTVRPGASDWEREACSLSSAWVWAPDVLTSSPGMP